METDPKIQIEMFDIKVPVVHYYDKNGALHSGRLVRHITSGRNKGSCEVINAQGKKIIPFKIRNIQS